MKEKFIIKKWSSYGSDYAIYRVEDSVFEEENQYSKSKYIYLGNIEQVNAWISLAEKGFYLEF